jgi:D-methionine transport system substrate-binding protein
MGSAQGTILKIGVTAGPHKEIMEHLKERATSEGLTLEIIEFNDFILPNSALQEKDLDANSYQHLPFLKNQVATRGYDLVSVGPTILLPLGAYSKKISSLNCLKEGDSVAIPNDPTNEGRALLLLQKEGVIKLKETQESLSLLDIIENPKNIKFIEVEAPQLPRVLDDVEAALINTDWVWLAKLDTEKTLLTQEETPSPYANVLVVRAADKNRKEIEQLMSLYHSEDTRRFIEKKFGKAVIPAWRLSSSQPDPCVSSPLAS